MPWQYLIRLPRSAVLLTQKAKGLVLCVFVEAPHVHLYQRGHRLSSNFYRPDARKAERFTSPDTLPATP